MDTTILYRNMKWLEDKKLPVTLFSATFGLLGVFVATYIVTSVPIGILKWIAAVVISLAAIQLGSDLLKKKEE